MSLSQSRILTHGDDRECPNVQSGEWKYCKGHSLPATPGGGAPDVTECLQMLLGWFDNGKKRHLAGKLVYLPTERMEECRAALAAAVPPAAARLTGQQERLGIESA